MMNIMNEHVVISYSIELYHNKRTMNANIHVVAFNVQVIPSHVPCQDSIPPKCKCNTSYDIPMPTLIIQGKMTYNVIDRKW